jgi:hypothetical protein
MMSDLNYTMWRFTFTADKHVAAQTRRGERS